MMETEAELRERIHKLEIELEMTREFVHVLDARSRVDHNYIRVLELREKALRKEVLKLFGVEEEE